jgi:N utilization substance protein A
MGIAMPKAPEAEETQVPVSLLLAELGAVEGLDEPMAEKLGALGYIDAKSLYTATAEQLLGVDGMNQDLAFRLIDAVHERFGE